MEKETRNYIKPFTTKSLLDAYRNRDLNIIRSEKAKMSYVRDIFVSPKYVIVTYEGPVKKENEANIRLQFYTLDGNFLEEIPIPGKPGSRMYFDKKRDILYSLSDEVDDDLNVKYFFIEYKISDKKMVKK